MSEDRGAVLLCPSRMFKASVFGSDAALIADDASAKYVRH
jgi:hypothetical protein